MWWYVCCDRNTDAGNHVKTLWASCAEQFLMTNPGWTSYLGLFCQPTNRPNGHSAKRPFGQTAHSARLLKRNTEQTNHSIKLCHVYRLYIRSLHHGPNILACLVFALVDTTPPIKKDIFSIYRHIKLGFTLKKNYKCDVYLVLCFEIVSVTLF